MTTEATARRSDSTEVGTSGDQEPSLAHADPTSLVIAARDGNSLAWEELVHRFTPLLWIVARGHRLPRDEAADVVQTTWLRCVERLEQVRDPSSVAAWLVTICRRESLAVLDRQARARSGEASDPTAQIPDPLVRDVADVLIKQEERKILREVISRLPDRPRQLLLALLEASAGTSNGYRHIARQLDLPIGSIGPTRQRALHRLRADPRLQSLRNH